MPNVPEASVSSTPLERGHCDPGLADPARSVLAFEPLDEDFKHHVAIAAHLVPGFWTHCTV